MEGCCVHAFVHGVVPCFGRFQPPTHSAPSIFVEAEAKSALVLAPSLHRLFVPIYCVSLGHSGLEKSTSSPRYLFIISPSPSSLSIVLPSLQCKSPLRPSSFLPFGFFSTRSRANKRPLSSTLIRTLSTPFMLPPVLLQLARSQTSLSPQRQQDHHGKSHITLRRTPLPPNSLITSNHPTWVSLKVLSPTTTRTSP